MTPNRDQTLSAGTQIRLIDDPGRVGVLTGATRERAGTLNYQVSFPEGKSYQAAYAIEVIHSDNVDPYAMIESGRFGRVSDLRRNLLHIQLSGRLANLVYSMETTNTDFYAYQFKPVLSFLESPSKGLLIADEVGLGKTIEAGLIWTELRARYDARRLVVVCPAMLREKWRDELRERFGVNAAIVDAAQLVDELKQNKHEVPDGKALICSMQGLRPPRHWDDEDSPRNPSAQLASLLTDQANYEPIIDLLIVDEAHYLRNPESQTAKLGTMLRDVSEHIVLLSATPVNLKEDDLFHLLKLVDPDSFAVNEYFPQVLEANRPLLEARKLTLDKRSNADEIKELLKAALTHEPLKNSSQLKNLIDENLNDGLLESDAERVLLANRIERVNLFRHAVSRTRKVEVTEWKVVREPFTELVKLNQTEIDFYNDVTEAVQNYASSLNVSAGFLLSSPQRQISSCMFAALDAWNRKIGVVEEQIFEDFGVETDGASEIAPLIDYLARNVVPNHDPKLLRLNDSKFERFENIVLNYLEENVNEKIVVFSYFRGTLDYLSGRLGERGIKNQVLVGGMAQTKQEIINGFKEDPSIRVLLSSEVASEGVDLQFCRFLINYDLPWNPMKIEQRIGRLDRIGQKAEKISIWNLCYENTIDQRILERLFVRLNIFEKALGGLEAILGEEIVSLTNDILSSGLSSEQIDQRIEATALAIERTRQDKESLEKEASNLIAHQGYILAQVHAAHDFSRRITKDDLVLYVGEYLNKYCLGNTFRRTQNESLVFNIRLPAEAAVSIEEFVRERRLQGQTRLGTGDEIECEFVSKVPAGRQSKEFINQFHPLVRFISADLKKREEAYFPMVASKIVNQGAFDIPNGVYGFVISLWAFEGLRVEEEIRAEIISLDRLTTIASDEAWDLISGIRSKGEDWLAAPNELDTELLVKSIDRCADNLQKKFVSLKLDKELENRDRVAFQVQSAQRHRDRHLETHRRVLAGLREKNHLRLIPAREGLINKAQERYKMQEELLRRKGELRSSSFEICFGAIRVE